MARKVLRAVIAAVIAGSTSCFAPLDASGPEPTADLNVLFVGNSLTYTNDLPGTLSHLLSTYGGVGSVHVESVAFADFGLEDHWQEGSALARIAAGGWDVVVVQQGPSATEGRPSLIEYAGRFSERVSAIGGRLAVYMVWPARSRFFDFDGVSDSHRTAAAQAGALLFPAGEAWRSAWAVDPDLALYGADAFHPSRLGSYLAALVMFEQLSGVDPRTLPDGIIGPGGVTPLPDGVSTIVRDAAAEANRLFAMPSAR